LRPAVRSTWDNRDVSAALLGSRIKSALSFFEQELSAEPGDLQPDSQRDMAFVDAIERYPGVVSLGGPLELPFLGGKAGAEVLNVPIRFYMNSPNDPSWMIQKGGFAVIAQPAGPSAAPRAP
jgi:hypothetical protein